MRGRPGNPGTAGAGRSHHTGTRYTRTAHGHCTPRPACPGSPPWTSCTGTPSPRSCRGSGIGHRSTPPFLEDSSDPCRLPVLFGPGGSGILTPTGLHGCALRWVTTQPWPAALASSFVPPLSLLSSCSSLGPRSPVHAFPALTATPGWVCVPTCLPERGTSLGR